MNRDLLGKLLDNGFLNLIRMSYENIYFRIIHEGELKESFQVVKRKSKKGLPGVAIFISYRDIYCYERILINSMNCIIWGLL